MFYLHYVLYVKFKALFFIPLISQHFVYLFNCISFSCTLYFFLSFKLFIHHPFNTFKVYKDTRYMLVILILILLTLFCHLACLLFMGYLLLFCYRTKHYSISIIIYTAEKKQYECVLLIETLPCHVTFML